MKEINDLNFDASSAPAEEKADIKNTTIICGVTLAFALAAAGIFLSKAPFWPFTTAAGRNPLDAVLLAIVLGMLVGNLWKVPGSFRAGIQFSVNRFLPFGVILLGARLDFHDLLAVGVTGIVLSVLEVLFALALFLYLTHRFDLPARQGLLLGVGTAICGGTAIVAVAPVIKAKDEEVVMAVATVTLLGLIAMFSLPVMAEILGLGPRAFGIWTGLTVHQTPQVIAAGFAHSLEAGEVATIIKLARVCLLAPVVFCTGVYWAWKENAGSAEKVGLKRYLGMFPTFVLGFLALALANTWGFIPDVDLQWEAAPAFLEGSETGFSLQWLLVKMATLFLAVSMAGVGLETRFSCLCRTSRKALLAAGLGALVIGLLGLGAAILVT